MTSKAINRAFSFCNIEGTKDWFAFSKPNSDSHVKHNLLLVFPIWSFRKTNLALAMDRGLCECRPQVKLPKEGARDHRAQLQFLKSGQFTDDDVAIIGDAMRRANNLRISDAPLQVGSVWTCCTTWVVSKTQIKIILTCRCCWKPHRPIRNFARRLRLRCRLSCGEKPKMALLK